MYIMGETLQEVFTDIGLSGRTYLPQPLDLLGRVNTVRSRAGMPLLDCLDPSRVHYHPTHAIVDGVRIQLGTETITETYRPTTEVYKAIASAFPVSPVAIVEGKQAQEYVVKAALSNGAVTFSCPHANFRYAEVQLDFPFEEDLYVAKNGKTLLVRKITAERGEDARMEAVEVEPVCAFLPPPSLIAHQLGRIFEVVPREMSRQISFHYDADQKKAFVKYHAGDGNPSAKRSLEELIEILSEFSLWNATG